MKDKKKKDNILGDHLGSTSLVTDSTCNVISDTKYKAWGEERYTSGTKQTDYTYTGQFSYTADFGLMYYGARFYDSSLGRFTSADSIVPAGVQGYDRYAYVNNNPVKYTDPTGHVAWNENEGFSEGGCVSGDLVCQLAGSTNRQNLTAAIIENIKDSSSSDADTLIAMFTSNTLDGETSKERLETVLLGTKSGPGGQQFGVGFNDSGFESRFQDGRNQVGHFLTAVSMAYGSTSPVSDQFYLKLITGHEMFGDSGVPSVQHFGQWIYGEINGGKAIDLFLSGQDSAYEEIIEMGFPNPAYRNGNSTEDLRLSYAGWTFGKLTQSGFFSSRIDQANWLENNLMR